MSDEGRMSEGVPVEWVHGLLAQARAGVHSRLEALVEDDGAYLNVLHVKYQLAQIDLLFDRLTMDAGRWAEGGSPEQDWEDVLAHYERYKELKEQGLDSLLGSDEATAEAVVADAEDLLRNEDDGEDGDERL
jgi:hypothetical protein